MWQNGRDMKHKHFYVVAYDIGDNKRRDKVMKLMESMGARVNYSVFECMLTEVQYKRMVEKLSKIVVVPDDWVNVYPICTECYARIRYIPERGKKKAEKIVVV